MGIEVSEFRWELTRDSSQEWDKLSVETFDIFILLLFESLAGDLPWRVVLRIVDILVRMEDCVLTDEGDLWTLLTWIFQVATLSWPSLAA